ncbi:MAG: hypothetical protein IPF87_00120 [Gemmatimonadetes bacterium]|nr:hypothetical protein [Gemmatimonadota bacterium]
MSRDVFSDHPVRRDIIRFVGVLSRSPRTAPSTPVSLPSTGKWLVRVLAREHRLVVGLYRRQMKAIGYLGALNGVYGVPITTRNWNTIGALARVLGARQAPDP